MVKLIASIVMIILGLFGLQVTACGIEILLSSSSFNSVHLQALGIWLIAGLLPLSIAIGIFLWLLPSNKESVGEESTTETIGR